MTTFFSVDVETSGLTPDSGVLLTVGIHVVRDGALTHESLYVRIDRSYSLREWETGKGSYDWWQEQDQRVKDEAFYSDDLVRHDPRVAAMMIAEFVTSAELQPEGRVFVANPVAFDKMWMTTLFDETGVPDPFHYRSLCLRSMKFGMRPRSEWGNDREDHKPAIPHHALWDARAQALDLVKMLAERDTTRAVDE